VQVNGGKRFLADESGRFRVPITGGGPWSLLVRRIGFEPSEVRFDEVPDTVMRLRLIGVPVQLKEVLVTGGSAFRSLDTHGFYTRMRDSERGINHGYFVTPEDLERRKPNWISQMAEGNPTVRVRRGRDPKFDVITGTGGCRMTVYLDNIRIVGKLNGPDDFVNEIVPPNHVAAMEIYPRSVGAPPQYQSLNGTCGVVLIWTK
jgi:hypothetical protein